MESTYQIADLTVTLEGSIEELVDTQGVAREFSRACEKIRAVAGGDVRILLDEGLQSEEGREFSKIRLRASDQSRNFTIDVGTTEDNLLGIYVPWDAPVEVYNRKDDSVREVRPFAEESSQDEPQEESSQEASSAGQSGPDAAAPPTPQTGEQGRLEKESALQLWNAAKAEGHTKDSFARMLASVAGVKKPRLIHERDWPEVWKYAVSPADWKIEHDVEERELPLE